jgi:hypothetical protein
MRTATSVHSRYPHNLCKATKISLAWGEAGAWQPYFKVREAQAPSAAGRLESLDVPLSHQLKTKIMNKLRPAIQNS